MRIAYPPVRVPPYTVCDREFLIQNSKPAAIMNPEVTRVSTRTISSSEIYRNKWCSVREDIIERLNDATGEAVQGIFGVMDKDPGSIVIALEHEAGCGEFIWLVRQFRYTVQGTYFEMPQGGWEGVSVDPVGLGHAELREETGLRAG